LAVKITVPQDLLKKEKQFREVKFCPLLRANCIQSECGWWNEREGECSLPVLAKNLKRLVKAE